MFIVVENRRGNSRPRAPPPRTKTVERRSYVETYLRAAREIRQPGGVARATGWQGEYNCGGRRTWGREGERTEGRRNAHCGHDAHTHVCLPCARNEDSRCEKERERERGRERFRGGGGEKKGDRKRCAREMFPRRVSTGSRLESRANYPLSPTPCTLSSSSSSLSPYIFFVFLSLVRFLLFSAYLSLKINRPLAYLPIYLPPCFTFPSPDLLCLLLILLLLLTPLFLVDAK